MHPVNDDGLTGMQPRTFLGNPAVLPITSRFLPVDLHGIHYVRDACGCGFNLISRIGEAATNVHDIPGQFKRVRESICRSCEEFILVIVRGGSRAFGAPLPCIYRLLVHMLKDLTIIIN
ncbi:hypothetical protein AVEN_254714-1 [Araneus ventricosus]|uniref:Uncharacterized protein n=1 Tax=Araneus ventricosus TaxID=182803 RepID=A0A4Y2RIE3_ARAVE|nr:hypothetical protein AVEN_254714-1 [Araneus ventricosus]